MNTPTTPGERMQREAASLRDPAGFVFYENGRVRRAVTAYGLPHARAVRETGLIDRLIASGQLLPEEQVATRLEGYPEVQLVLEHPRLPFVSYPYEWPFRALQAAALLHLDVQLAALDAGVMLTDASAYNVQFIGPRPVFIDHLAFRPYRDGELWAGHRQFCEQFLHPLLLQSVLGVEYHSWYRGRLEGVPGDDLSRLLPWHRKLGWNMLTNVVLPARLQQYAGRPGVEGKIARARMPREGLRSMFESLRRWIARLVPRGMHATTWHSYDATVPDTESSAIDSFVREFIAAIRPSLVWDLGCNAGRYSETALLAGAGYVVGLDSDPGALDQAFIRAGAQELAFLPLLVDLVNPSPAQGWRQLERFDLGARGRPDALIAVAVVHHIAIARNIPLAEVVRFLTSVAADGVIGFVPPSDARARELFRGREDIFGDYNIDKFVTELQSKARVLRQDTIPGTDRVLLSFSTR